MSRFMSLLVLLLESLLGVWRVWVTNFTQNREKAKTGTHKALVALIGNSFNESFGLV